MFKQNLRDLIEFDEKKFLAKTVVNQPGYRMILLNFRAGQGMPEHSAREMVTVYVISGHITFYENNVPAEMRAGEVVWMSPGASHRVDAHEDSSLLVIRAGGGASASAEEELDLRQVPRPERHPMVFGRFDGLPLVMRLSWSTTMIPCHSIASWKLCDLGSCRGSISRVDRISFAFGFAASRP